MENDLSFFGQILDTGQDFIYSLGENARNASDANATRIEIARTQAALANKKLAGDEKRKDEALKIGRNVIYTFMGIILIIILAKFVIPSIPKNN